jgi:hypothetical protein
MVAAMERTPIITIKKVQAALEKSGGVRSDAARLLKCSTERIRCRIREGVALGMVFMESPHKSSTKGEYIPTLEEIKRACELFQEGWGPGERERRFGYKCQPEYPGIARVTLCRSDSFALDVDAKVDSSGSYRM